MQQYATEGVAFESDGTHCGRPGHAVLGDPALSELFRNVEQNAPSWRNQVSPRFYVNAPYYRDGTMKRIAAPLMVTVASDDKVVSSAFVKEKAAKAKHQQIREYRVHHFEMYHGAVQDRVAADQLAFLQAHLLGVPTGPTQDGAQREHDRRARKGE